MKKICILGIVILFTFSLLSCGKRGFTKKKPVSIKAKEIVVTEMGLADTNNPENQQKYLSKQAATIQAERAIRRAIESYIESEAIVDKGMIKSDIVREKVSGTLKGSEIVKVKYDDPATCYVTMRISKKNVESLLKLLAAMEETK